MQEKAALERELEAAKKIIAENEERGIARQSDLFKKAYRSLLKGDIEEALNQLSVEELEKRKDVDLWTLRAEILFFIKKDFNQTIQCYKKIIELNPDYAAAYNNMGIAYQYLGNPEAANACFQKASMIRNKQSFTEDQ